MSGQHPQRIPSLDGIRGIFSIVVFLAHVKLMWFDDWLGKGSNWYFGNLGVTIFFFISGYIITTLMRLEYEKHADISLSNFFLRRIYRLLPPFYIVLLINVALTATGVLEGPLYWSGFLTQALHFSNYLEAFNPGEVVLIQGTGVMWSLAVEEHFYLLFPLMFLPLIRRRSYRDIAAIMAVICGAVLCWRFFLHFGLDMHRGYFRIATDTRIDSILTGCILGLVANPALDKPLWDNRWWRIALLSGSVLVLIGGNFIDHPAFPTTVMYTAQALAFYAVVGYSVRYPDWWCFRWLNWRPLIALGLISYTFYLIHLPILKILNNHTDWSTFTQGMVGFVASAAFSTVMYYVVEMPMTRLRKRLRRT